MDMFSAAWEDFGLAINTIKTEVMHQPTPAAMYTEPTSTVGGRKLAVGNKCTYLGSTLSRTIDIEEEVTYSIEYSNMAFGRLHTRVWE